MDTYYHREKIYNILGIGIVLFFIFKGLELIFSPGQIFVILAIRVFFMQREGKLQSILLFILLYAGNIWEYNYITIQYFEYIMLAFFFTFFIYNIYVSSSTKKLRDTLLVILGISILISINIYNTNNRLFKDSQLQKIVNKKYASQFIVKEKLNKADSRLENIVDLYIGSKFSVKNLDGIENLKNLKNINISRQDKLIDYSKIKHLNNLKYLSLYELHPGFSIHNLPELGKLEYLSWELGRNRFLNDEIIELTNFPNLEHLNLYSFDDKRPITVDISNVPNIETIEIWMNIERIIGLEEAKNLKNMDLPYVTEDYMNEIKRMRPDIELR